MKANSCEAMADPIERHPLYTVMVISRDAQHFNRHLLPFVPVPGMYLKCIWDRDDYRRVDEVYFDYVREIFEVYMADPEAS